VHNSDDEQLPLAVRAAPRRRPVGVKVAASTLPIARVAVDIALPHLDRPFDYQVPESLAAQAAPGTRVRVRFAGQLVDGFVVERLAASDHEGRLAFLERVVSPEVVLTPAVFALARAVAQRWAGTVADVLRLAIPPRHARVEAESRGFAAPPHTRVPGVPARYPAQPAGGDWSRYQDGDRFIAAVRSGRSPRAVWAATPGGCWPAEIASLVEASIFAGRGALVVLPDARDAHRVGDSLRARLGDGRHVVLTADVGPAERYRRFLAVRRGEVSVVIGTRAAAFAPVSNLGLVVLWDDGDDVHAEPRAPYPHAREVLLLRAQLASLAAVVGSHAVSAEGARLLSSGWATLVVASRATVRERAPLVLAPDGAGSTGGRAAAGRLPSFAWQLAHDALARDEPVLVQVPRSGYLPALACNACRTPLRCSHCSGPLAAAESSATPTCRWCGRLAAGWRCQECGGRRFRAVVVGVRRTAEELGRAFPGVPVRTSAGGDVLDRVPAGRSVVIATPGAEPIADDGYGAALLLDGWAMLGRADLRAGEEALRRWLNAAALVRTAANGGRVAVVADSSLRPVQALLRWDPVGHAERELAERMQLGFPPAAVFAELVGDGSAVAELVAVARLPAATALLGPVPLDSARAERPAVPATPATPAVRALLRAPRAAAAELAAALHEAQGVRSARKLPVVRVRIDPHDIG
jgi:primosomal protein N' (replication factor Y) (superfamily II helicase)